MTTSCPGFLDRYGVWNNGFDCSSSRVCCGSETDRYCCMPTSPATLSSTLPSVIPYESSNDYFLQRGNDILPEKWFFLQICTVGIFLTMTLLIFVMVCQCLSSIRRSKQRQQRRMSSVQMPLPAASPLLLEHNRSMSNRISTISTTPSDAKSRCTETSLILNTPLNLYPIGNSRDSTASSSYYMFPNEFEHLCK
ncbi:unnamed protein product [Adineta ricciae]|uniref:Shisa N-terminal domain-containing protein n=1 Tax=Adineta ricciae TaxID=249248 RepID=A0A816C511_ADIRI|nr:unnamed protein product [Adineta ricciae]